MSYLAAVADLEPYFYFPMTVRRENNFPLDFSSNSEATVEGFFEYKRLSSLIGPFLSLTTGGPLSFSNLGGDLGSSTLSFWIISNETSEEIINIGGLDLQSSDTEGVFSIVANSSVIAQFQEREIIAISIVFDGTDGFLYINGTEVYSFPAQSFSEIAFGGTFEPVIAEISFFKSVLSPEDILNLYNVGITGGELASVSVESGLSFSGDIKSLVQTVWQAYGIVSASE